MGRVQELVAEGFTIKQAAHVARMEGELAEAIRERAEARDWVRRLTEEQRVLTCAFCGEAYPPGTPETNHERLTAHVDVCAKHPAAKLRARVALATRFTLPDGWEISGGYRPGTSWTVARHGHAVMGQWEYLDADGNLVINRAVSVPSLDAAFAVHAAHVAAPRPA